jgi:hypothetical protein
MRLTPPPLLLCLQQQSGAILGAMAAAGGAEAVLSAVRSLRSSEGFRAAAAAPEPLPPITRSLLATTLASDEGAATVGPHSSA